MLYTGPLLSKLFPDLEDDAQLIEYLKDYYSIGPIQPEVQIKGDLIIVDIDTDSIETHQKIHDELIKSVENGDYETGEKLALELVELNPHVSDYHRMLGQVYYEIGRSDEAMNALIEALRWDPQNGYALVLMGNLHSVYKKDVAAAMVFYEKALEEKPDDYLALSNIGANLMKLKQFDKAEVFLQKALESNPEFAKTHLAMAMVAEQQGDMQKAFDHSIKCLKYGGGHASKNKVEIENALNIARNIVETVDGLKWIEVFKEALEKKTGTEIRVEEDINLNTSAKIEYAENYDRDYHLVKYKANKSPAEHLILHELVHLELAEEARAHSANQLFVSGQKENRRFKHYLSKFIKKLAKRGVAQENIKNYIEALFHGINSQVFNTPIDLFIEDRINNYYPILRPFQFLSLYIRSLEGAEAVTREDIVKSSPKEIVSKSKIYNLINALHFKNLYHIDLIPEHKASKTQLDTAKNLYQGFLAIREDKEPGQEYDLVYGWAKRLQLHRYFSLIDEREYRAETREKRTDTDSKRTENHPQIEERVRTFVENHEGEVNMAVVMYMIDALSYFSSMSKEEIKKIAFDLAHLGQSGIDPNKDGYRIASIPGSNFSGYKTLAYYYVSWALGVPEMLAQLGMPFDEEYEIAQKMREEDDG